MFTIRKECIDKRYNSPGRRAIVAGLMAATLLSNVSGIAKYAYAETPTTAQIKTTNVDLAKLKLQKLNLNMNDYEVIHKDPTTQINTFDSSAYFSQPGNGWAPTSIIQFSSQIDKSKDHIVIDNPVEILFKNTGYYFGRQTNVRMKVNRVYYDAIDYSGTSYASTSTRERRMSKPGDEVMFAELDNAAGEKGVVQFTNYNFYTGEPNAAPYVHPVQGSKQNTLNSWYTMRADVTYTIEYADGTQADMKLVVPVGDLDVISYVNKAKGDGAGQNEMFELPNADSQASKIIFNRNFAARLTRPSDNNGTMVINPPTNSIGGNSLDWMYNTTGATIRSRSNSLTFTSGSADASGTDFGVYVEHPAVDPVKKVDKTRIASYQDGKLVYTIQSTIPKVGTDVIDDIDEFSIDDLLDNRLKNVTVKGVYVTDSEDADPSTADWRKLPSNKYTIDTTGQRLKVNIDKSQLGHKQVKVIFETDTLATDLSADTSIINNQATVHTDDVPSKSNVTRTQPTYKFDHKFVAEDGSELPQGIKDITPANVENQYKPNEVITADSFEVPADKKPADGTEYADASKKQFVDTERDGVWEFVSWDKDNITVDHSDDNLFTGIWKFNGYSHKATYEFVSGTPGKELPKSIVDMTPTDPVKYTKGTEVPAKSEFEKTVKDEDNDGTWTFKSYDHDKQTVEKSDIKFVGTWEFTPNTYPVGYEFKSSDPKRELPKVVKDKLPKDDKTYITKTPVDAQKIPNDPVYDPELDIDWTFNKWDSPKKTIEREGIKFTGEWTPKQREYKVTYKFTSGTPGKELPKEVTDLLPKDDKTYVTGSKVKSNKPSKTEVKVDGGTWKFKEFPPELTIDKKDGEFAGEWVFEADPEPAKPAAKPVPKTGDATTVAPAVGGIAAIMTSILAFFGIKRKSDE